MSDPVVHDAAWRFLRAYRAWFIAADGPNREEAREVMRLALEAWANIGLPLLDGEVGVSSPPKVRRRAR